MLGSGAAKIRRSWSRRGFGWFESCGGSAQLIAPWVRVVQELRRFGAAGRAVGSGGSGAAEMGWLVEVRLGGAGGGSARRSWWTALLQCKPRGGVVKMVLGRH